MKRSEGAEGDAERLRGRDACPLCESSSWITYVSALFVDHTVTPRLHPPTPPPAYHTHAHTHSYVRSLIRRSRKRPAFTSKCVTVYLITLRLCLGNGKLPSRHERRKEQYGVRDFLLPPPHPIQTLRKDSEAVP